MRQYKTEKAVYKELTAFYAWAEQAKWYFRKPKTSRHNAEYRIPRDEVICSLVRKLVSTQEAIYKLCEAELCNDALALSRMGAALLRRRPKGLLPAARQELLDPSKVWWGGRRGRLADRPRYSISVSLGVVPLVLPRRGSPSTHRSRGWLRSTRSFRTASAPTQFATRRIRARAWMKQRYWVAPACTSELHHGRGPGTARPFDDAGGDGTQAPPCRRTRPRG